MRRLPTPQLLILGTAVVLWPLLMFIHPWGEWFSFWQSPLWAATELLLAALALCFGRTWGEAAALLLGTHWLFYHGVVTTDGGRPVLGDTLGLWFDRARLKPIYFAGYVLAVLILSYAVFRLARRHAKRPSLP